MTPKGGAADNGSVTVLLLYCSNKNKLVKGERPSRD